MSKIPAIVAMAIITIVTLTSYSVTAQETVTCKTSKPSKFAQSEYVVEFSKIKKAECCGHVGYEEKAGRITKQLRIRKDGSAKFRLIMNGNWLPGTTMYECNYTSTEILNRMK